MGVYLLDIQDIALRLSLHDENWNLQGEVARKFTSESDIGRGRGGSLEFVYS